MNKKDEEINVEDQRCYCENAGTVDALTCRYCLLKYKAEKEKEIKELRFHNELLNKRQKDLDSEANKLSKWIMNLQEELQQKDKQHKAKMQKLIDEIDRFKIRLKHHAVCDECKLYHTNEARDNKCIKKHYINVMLRWDNVIDEIEQTKQKIKEMMK
jgi:hypothetical protein